MAKKAVKRTANIMAKKAANTMAKKKANAVAKKTANVMAKRMEGQRIDKPKRDILIPILVFNKDLSSLETISKYMKENLGFNYKRIALLANRSEKTIWQAYSSSRKKFPGKFKTGKSRYHFPISILRTRYYSILESIVVFLKENNNLTYHDISVLLKRDDRTIWTVYKRAEKKKRKENAKIKESMKKIDELTKRIKMCEEYKNKVIKFVAEMKKKYEAGEIGYTEYRAKLQKHLEGRSAEEWIRYYDGMVAEYAARCAEEAEFIDEFLRKKD